MRLSKELRDAIANNNYEECERIIERNNFIDEHAPNIDFFTLLPINKHIQKLFLENISLEMAKNDDMLYHATICRDIQSIDILLKKGYDINSTDDFGRTVLHNIVSISPNVESRGLQNIIEMDSIVAKFLINHGINPEIKDYRGNTVLDYPMSNYLRNKIKSHIENSGLAGLTKGIN